MVLQAHCRRATYGCERLVVVFFFVGTFVGCGTGEYVCHAAAVEWDVALEKRRRMRSLSVTFGEGGEWGGERFFLMRQNDDDHDVG